MMPGSGKEAEGRFFFFIVYQEQERRRLVFSQRSGQRCSQDVVRELRLC
jgi:hypothetical protein